MLILLYNLFSRLYYLVLVSSWTKPPLKMLAFNDLKRNNYCDKDSLFSSKKSYDYCLIESIGNCNRYWILFTKIQTSVVFFFFKENLMNTLLVKEGMTNCLHTRIRRIHLNETRNKGKNNHVLHSARN